MNVAIVGDSAHDRACSSQDSAPSARDRERSVHTTDSAIVYIVVHCLGSLFGTLIMSTIHGHC